MAIASDFFNVRNLVDKVKTGRMTPGALARAVGRTVGLFGITLGMGIELTIAHQLVGGKDPTLGARRMKVWCATVCRLFQVRCRVTGTPPFGETWERAHGGRPTGVLLVCNHRSYSDIPVVGSLLPIVFVSKAELRDWPVIGWGGELAGTLFVARDNPDSRRQVRSQVLERLRQGLSVLNYPEGTTHGGEGMLPFKRGLFGVVAGQELELVPVVLTYPPTVGIEWAGQMTFLDHLLEKAGGGPIDVGVHFCAPIRCEAHPEPDALMALVRSRMTEALEGAGS